MHYYVYLLERKDGTAKYVGSRESKLPPEEDFGKVYHSSGTLKEAFHKTPDDFVWQILSQYANRHEANIAEQTCIKLLKNDPACVNGAPTLQEDEARLKKVLKKVAKAKRKVSAAEQQRYDRVARALMGAPGYEEGTPAWYSALREAKLRDVAKLVGLNDASFYKTYADDWTEPLPHTTQTVEPPAQKTWERAD
jgi:hypothetical protein